jgi:hypothetical protein
MERNGTTLPLRIFTILDIVEYTIISEISGSLGGEYEYDSLLGYCAV